ncbi:carboxypeptidase S1 [Coleophoma cylindrospora]|uniref:Carboxypeptidase S1 n=1 Tax=Coleophoma cylindrospora TaxID=1849047 RepID=A0A3D8SPY5_9HELO|nr:carboxypeptidase S1 [Coleophoma cylindrospora]
MFFNSISLLILFITYAVAQFVPPPTDLKTVQGAGGITVRYKEVPTGTCETNPNVKSYSGYADVGPNQHIFFWFFEARAVNATQAPLTVRLDGGPGASSMNGLFQEIGPCTIDAAGNVVNNPYSWSNNSNMLFIDQPATVGFSYTIATKATQSSRTFVITPTDTCTTADPGCGTYSSPDTTLTPNSTQEAAVGFYNAMQGFMGAFPQYAANGVHINTASYGGHYGPIFADYIVKQNKVKAAGTVDIPLKTLMIENGFYDTRVQFAAYYNYTVSPGNTYNLNPYTAAQEQQLYTNIWGAGGCQDQQAKCNANPPPADIDNVCAAADTFCVAEVEDFFDINARRNEDDVRELAPDPFPPTYYVDYLNKANVLQAIGATTNFTQASVQTFFAFNSTGDDSRTGAIINTAMQTILQEGVTVTTFAGDADYDSNWIGGQVVANNVNAPGWTQAGFVNLTTTDGVVRGQTRQADGFSFTRVYFAGHEAPFYQPEATLQMFERAISGMDIATGKMPMALGKNVTTQGTQSSTFMEGPGTIQTTVTPAGSTYNTTTHAPNVAPAQKAKSRFVVSEELVPPPTKVRVTHKKFKKLLVEERRARKEASRKP